MARGAARGAAAARAGLQRGARTFRKRWMRPTGNCRPALMEREIGFFLSPLAMTPLAPLPDRPFAPLPDMVVVEVVGGGGGEERAWSGQPTALRQRAGACA